MRFTKPVFFASISRISWRLLLYLSSLLLLSCTQALTPALPDVHNAWLDTTSTKEAIAYRLGQPADVVQTAEDQSTWLYFAMSSRPTVASFLPFVGFVAAGATIDISQLRVQFIGDHFAATTYDQIIQFQSMYAGITEHAPVFADERMHVVAAMAALNKPFDPVAWRTAQGSLRMWQMLRD